MNKTRTYYQPYLRWDDEDWELPDELMSFHAFATKGDAEEFVANMSYSNYELKIEEYHDDDIEGVTILDAYGEIVEINEDDMAMPEHEEYFSVIRVSRADFEAVGYDASGVSDVDMEHMALKLGEALLSGGDFWLFLEYWGEEKNLPKFEKKEE